MPYEICSDAFPYADAIDLTAASSSWSTVNAGGLIAVSSHAAAMGSSVNEACVKWVHDPFPDDHYAQGTYTVLDPNADLGLAVRIQPGAESYYAVYCRQNYCVLFKRVAGSNTTLTYGFPNFSTPVTIKLAAVGTTLTVYRDGVPLLSRADADFPTGGACGIGGYNFMSTTRLDDWSAGGTADRPPNSPYVTVRRPGRTSRRR